MGIGEPAFERILTPVFTGSICEEFRNIACAVWICVPLPSQYAGIERRPGIVLMRWPIPTSVPEPHPFLWSKSRPER